MDKGFHREKMFRMGLSSGADFPSQWMILSSAMSQDFMDKSFHWEQIFQIIGWD